MLHKWVDTSNKALVFGIVVYVLIAIVGILFLISCSVEDKETVTSRIESSNRWSVVKSPISGKCYEIREGFREYVAYGEVDCSYWKVE